MTVAWGDRPVGTEFESGAEASPHGLANGVTQDDEMEFVVFTLRGPDGVGISSTFLRAVSEGDEDAAVVDMNQVLHEDKLLMHLLIRSRAQSKSAVVKSMLLAAKAVNFDASFRFDHVDTYNPAEMMTPLDEGRVMTAVAEKVQISVALSSLQPAAISQCLRTIAGVDGNVDEFFLTALPAEVRDWKPPMGLMNLEVTIPSGVFSKLSEELATVCRPRNCDVSCGLLSGNVGFSRSLVVFDLEDVLLQSAARS